MARIYIETTVISFYFNARTEPEMVARENWSRRWLDSALAGTDELVTSLAVEAELNAGEFPHKEATLNLATCKLKQPVRKTRMGCRSVRTHQKKQP